MARGLPRLPVEESPAKAQVVRFGGLNYGQNVAPGELEDCRNLSAREFPYLSQRPGRQPVTEHSGVQAVYDHFGHLVVVKGNALYVDNTKVCDVTAGAKQFAPVNSQLVVWPDKIVVDVEEKKVVRDCKAVVTVNHFSSVMTANSITAPVCVPEKVGIVTTLEYETNIYTYGFDREAVEKCWNAETKSWDFKTVAATLKKTTALKVGEIVITDTAKQLVRGTQPDTSAYNTAGQYGVVTVVKSNGYSITHDTFTIGKRNVRFADCFSEGDTVDVTGGNYDICGVQKGQIVAVDPVTNTLTFADNAIRITKLCTGALPAMKTGQTVFLYYTFHFTIDSITSVYEYWFTFTPDMDMPAGHVVYCLEEDLEPYVLNGTQHGYMNIKAVRIWNREENSTVAMYTANKIEETACGDTAHTVSSAYIPREITIQRAVPELDYICSADNRLWGVSNKDRTIYGSEQGKPLQFYSNAASSIGSYSVAVGSNGDFTGCVECGDNVAFFKADRVHLLAGKEPSTYALYDYQYRGVAKGSHKSLANINENLFYLAEDGVYAFSGAGSPALISTAFGNRRFRNGVAGTDGERYYISMQDKKTDAWGVWVYDLKTGTWLQEDVNRIKSFANLDGVLYSGDANGNVKIMNPDSSTEKVQWSATFCPIDETFHERKCYSSLMLRYEMEEGSTLKAEISCDGGDWVMLKEVRAEKQKTSVLPIRPNRCDSFRIRLSGAGTVRLRSMVRSVIMGGYL